MANISLDLIKQLRDITGVGFNDCKTALYETDGDIERAVIVLRKKGAAVAQKRADKPTSQGLIEAYIHPGNSLGVIIEINCETDFVASTPDLRTFAKNLCMQVAAVKPRCITPEEVDPAFLQQEKDLIKEQLAKSGKPAQVLDKIMEGKLDKIYQDVCLIRQPYIKDDKQTVQDVLNGLVAKLGEKIVIKRFARFQVGVQD